ncbi:MAG: hypothetical protein WCV91_05140 [Candidatus Margulisiibacteriota bacterium]
MLFLSPLLLRPRIQKLERKLGELLDANVHPKAVTPDGHIVSVRMLAPDDPAGTGTPIISPPPVLGSTRYREVESNLIKFIFFDITQIDNQMLTILENGIYTDEVDKFIERFCGGQISRESIVSVTGRNRTNIPVEKPLLQHWKFHLLATMHYDHKKDCDKTIEHGEQALTYISSIGGNRPGTQARRIAISNYLGDAYYQRAKKLIDESEEIGDSATPNSATEPLKNAIMHLEAVQKHLPPDLGRDFNLFLAYYYLDDITKIISSLKTLLQYCGPNTPVEVVLTIWEVSCPYVLCATEINPWHLNKFIELYDHINTNLDQLNETQRSSVKVYAHVMGVVYALRGDYALAVEHLSKKDNWRTDPQFVYFMAYAELKRGNIPFAKELSLLLTEICPEYRKLHYLKKEIEKAEGQAARPVRIPEQNASVPARTLTGPTQRPLLDPALLSEIEIKAALLGEKGANREKLFTADKGMRQAIGTALEKAAMDLSEELAVLYPNEMRTHFFEITTVALQFETNEKKSILEILGIERIEIYAGAEARVFLAGSSKYFQLKITGSPRVVFPSGADIGEVGTLLEALILEAMRETIDRSEGQSLVIQALQTRPDVSYAKPDWAAIGRQAKAERTTAAKKEAEAITPQRAEKAFLTANAGSYEDLFFELDAHRLNLMDFEEELDRSISNLLFFLAHNRSIDSAPTYYEESVPECDPLAAIVSSVRIFGPIRAKQALQKKGVRQETTAELIQEPIGNKSPYLSMFEFDFVHGISKETLTAVLSADGRRLEILGVSKKDLDPLLIKSLYALAIERLTYRTARSIVDSFCSIPPETRTVSTASISLLRGILISLSRAQNAAIDIKDRNKRVLSAVKQAELHHIRSEGLQIQPLYVMVKGTYRRVSSSDIHYKDLIVLPPSRRFVKVAPGRTYRLSLGVKNTEEDRSAAQKQAPFYFQLSFDRDGSPIYSPSMQPLTLARLFGVSDPSLEGKALLPFEISEIKKQAYMLEGGNCLARDLAPRYFVYTITSYENCDDTIIICRPISGQDLQEIIDKLNKSKEQRYFLQQYLRGAVDVLAHSTFPAEKRDELRQTKEVKRLVIVASTNVGYMEGEFMSHEDFLHWEAQQIQAEATEATLPPSSL